MANVFFVLSKIGFFLVQPANLCLLATIAGIVMMRRERQRKSGFRIAVAGITVILAAGYSPIGNLLILPLEQRFPRPNVESLDAVEGIIILGGFEEGRVTKGRVSLSLNEAAERLTETIGLAKRFPTAKVIFTGGGGNVLGSDENASQAIREFLILTGVAADHIILEAHSRNTRENATLTHDLVKPRAGSRWLLVTSAYHMPRSIGIFRKVGFDVIAWPADYQTAGPGDILHAFDRIEYGLRRTNGAVKEYIGLVTYRLSGWTDSLWPGPEPTPTR